MTGSYQSCCHDIPRSGGLSYLYYIGFLGQNLELFFKAIIDQFELVGKIFVTFSNLL
jgi:hypothetical protein